MMSSTERFDMILTRQFDVPKERVWRAWSDADEVMATIRAATLPPSQEELLAAVALDIKALMQQKQNPARDFKPSSAPTAAAEILDELSGVDAIVAAKATPEETDAFRDWLIATAQAAADAAKEGGFMGFHAERVSAGEQAMLDQIRGALGRD